MKIYYFQGGVEVSVTAEPDMTYGKPNPHVAVDNLGQLWLEYFDETWKSLSWVRAPYISTRVVP